VHRHEAYILDWFSSHGTLVNSLSVHMGNIALPTLSPTEVGFALKWPGERFPRPPPFLQRYESHLPGQCQMWIPSAP
jgi:hypothetical protein